MKSTRQSDGRLKLLRRTIKYYYWKVIRNNGSPEYIARGAALGVFISFFVPIGLQIVAAVPLAFLFRAARIPTIVLTFVSNYATVLVFYPVQCYLGSYLIFNPIHWGELSEKLDSLLAERTLESFYSLGAPLIVSFFAGGILLGVITALPTYWGTLRLVIRYRRRREKKRLEKEAVTKL